MLYIFDLDGTLIQGYMDGGDYAHVQPLPGRIEKLAELRVVGHTVAIATNQGGIAFGYNSEGDFKAKLLEALRALKLARDTPVKVCFHHPTASIERYRDPEGCARRKPSGAMLKELMQELGHTTATTMYIGDRPEDDQAAAHAEVAFMWERDFFRAGVKG